MTKREKSLILILLVIIGFASYYLFAIKKFDISIISNRLKTSNVPKGKVSEENSLLSNSKTIPLQQINNVGYTFYIGQIDYPNTPAISDNTKNNITQVIYKANFPKKLLKDVGIILVNTLAVSEYQYIKTPNGKISIPSFSPDFMTGGGIYSGNFGEMSLIFINKTKLGSLSGILTHELGHYIGSQLTSEEWNKFYQLRNIPSNTPLQGQNWRSSPQEDFAEVYKSIFTEQKVATAYGLLLTNGFFIEETCRKIHDDLLDNYRDEYYYSKGDIFGFVADLDKIENIIAQDTQLQNCRKEVMSHPEKYPKEWEESPSGTPYYSVVDQATKDFIMGIINRLK